MSKLPEAGKSKTRLAAALGAKEAAGVQRVLLVHVVRRLAPLGELVISFDPPKAEAAMRELLGRNAMYVAQCSGDLGARISHAFENVAPDEMLLLGGDSPDVPITSISDAIDLLDENEVVLGPCEDGGYWCFGAKRNVRVASLLQNIEWSSGRELQQTLDRASSLGYRTALAPGWCDVDHADDLRRLVTRLRKTDNTESMQLLEKLASVLPPGAMSL
ncbi:MAG TPA: TIGR04282 family arsenosugar biosynthesis glycosyltransferase [Tepidisphaeraceae bacterium]